MNTKDEIYELIKNAGGWINVDEISAAIKLNRSDVAKTVHSMMNGKIYTGIERRMKRKTINTVNGQLPVFDIKYRFVG
jgi:predicted transcriptional regulator